MNQSKGLLGVNEAIARHFARQFVTNQPENENELLITIINELSGIPADVWQDDHAKVQPETVIEPLTNTRTLQRRVSIQTPQGQQLAARMLCAGMKWQDILPASPLMAHEQLHSRAGMGPTRKTPLRGPASPIYNVRLLIQAVFQHCTPQWIDQNRGMLHNTIREAVSEEVRCLELGLLPGSTSSITTRQKRAERAMREISALI